MRIFDRELERPYRFQALAIYNAERSRGIVHTPEWVAFMAEEQALFDAQPSAEDGGSLTEGSRQSDS